MADAREPYLVQVNSIGYCEGGRVITSSKTWLNIYYIARIFEAPKNDPFYKAGARWYIMLTNSGGVWVDDDDCEKIITNINGSY